MRASDRVSAPGTRSRTVGPRDLVRQSGPASVETRCLRIQIIATNRGESSRLATLLESVPDLVFVGAETLDQRGAGPSTTDADVVLVDAGDVNSAVLSELLAGIERPLVVVGVKHVNLNQLSPSSGGRAMLTLEAGVEEITAAIRAVAQSLLVIDARLVNNANAGLGDGQPSLLEALSSRELDVLRRMAEGWPNKEIACKLGISEHTVKFHVSAILSKLRARSRTDAVATAARRGLITL